MIRLNDLKEINGITILNKVNTGKTVTGAYTSDLLSDVMANAEEGSVLITIQAHLNTIAVASLCGLPGIIFCSGRNASSEVINAAEKEGIVLFSSRYNQFKTSMIIGKMLEN